MITAKIKRRGNVWHFDDYFKSLRKNKNEIAKPIRQFVSDPKKVSVQYERDPSRRRFD